jgi:hypothetical protein
VNGLSNAVRTGILQHLKAADADPAVKAVVITGSSKAFCGGADIREFNAPRLKPDLPEVNEQQDAMKKPLVAAIGGFRPRRRPRARARLPLPRRRAEGAARASRGEARNPAGLRRHPAAAAGDSDGRGR